jgi:hypothetical protein
MIMRRNYADSARQRNRASGVRQSDFFLGDYPFDKKKSRPKVNENALKEIGQKFRESIEAGEHARIRRDFEAYDGLCETERKRLRVVVDND